MSESTQLEEKYVDSKKLDDLLQNLFGNNYTVKVQGDIIEVVASRQLTDVQSS
ncbi:hypothetical protein F4811DRAFT_122096 [Daldinia bambusicola]|nr:hypothetical protein F4811DRAFT_122096 [Daldinia bambusicola]